MSDLWNKANCAASEMADAASELAKKAGNAAEELGHDAAEHAANAWVAMKDAAKSAGESAGKLTESAAVVLAQRFSHIGRLRCNGQVSGHRHEGGR